MGTNRINIYLFEVFFAVVILVLVLFTFARVKHSRQNISLQFVSTDKVSTCPQSTEFADEQIKEVLIQQRELDIYSFWKTKKKEERKTKLLFFTVCLFGL